MVDSPDFVPKLSNVEARSVLGWVTRRHVTFGGSVVTLGIRVTGLLVKNAPSLFGSEKDVGPGQLGVPCRSTMVLVMWTGLSTEWTGSIEGEVARVFRGTQA